jgi:hypothetical protein
MYEPSTGRWAVYDNPPAPKGTAAFSDVYNVTSMGDADGNGWWAQFATDVIVQADGSAPGKVISIKIPERKNSVWNLFTGDDRKIFEMMGGSEPHTRGVPYQHSMRMVGAGPGPTDSMWGVGWFSSDLVKVNIRTNELKVYDAPAPDCGSYQRRDVLRGPNVHHDRLAVGPGGDDQTDPPVDEAGRHTQGVRFDVQCRQVVVQPSFGLRIEAHDMQTWVDPHGEVWTVCQSSAQ